MIPQWLTQNDDQIPSQRTVQISPISRSMTHFYHLIGHGLFAADSADHEGWLQKIDPQVKIPGIISLVITATLVHQTAILGTILIICFLAALTSQLKMRPVLTIWLAVASITFFISIPAIFNIVTPGKPALLIAHRLNWISTSELSITSTGLLTGQRFILRAITCVALVTLLTFSTPWNKLLASLSVLKIPKPWILLMQMTQRYLFVMALRAFEMHLGKKSRTLVQKRNLALTRWASERIAALYEYNHRLSEQVSQAMAARGFNGEVKSASLPRPNRFSYAAGVGMMMGALLIVWIDWCLR